MQLSKLLTRQRITNRLSPLLATQKRAFASNKKYSIPTLEEYNELFNNSGIVEKLVPRELSEPEDLEGTFPSVLKNSCSGSEITGDTAYKLADTNALNKVSLCHFPTRCKTS